MVFSLRFSHTRIPCVSSFTLLMSTKLDCLLSNLTVHLIKTVRAKLMANGKHKLKTELSDCVLSVLLLVKFYLEFALCSAKAGSKSIHIYMWYLNGWNWWLNTLQILVECLSIYASVSGISNVRLFYKGRLICRYVKCLRFDRILASIYAVAASPEPRFSSEIVRMNALCTLHSVHTHTLTHICNHNVCFAQMQPCIECWGWMRPSPEKNNSAKETIESR